MLGMNGARGIAMVMAVPEASRHLVSVDAMTDVADLLCLPITTIGSTMINRATATTTHAASARSPTRRRTGKRSPKISSNTRAMMSLLATGRSSWKTMLVTLLNRVASRAVAATHLA